MFSKKLGSGARAPLFVTAVVCIVIPKLFAWNEDEN
jgi:hypothetical protein